MAPRTQGARLLNALSGGELHLLAVRFVQAAARRDKNRLIRIHASLSQATAGLRPKLTTYFGKTLNDAYRGIMAQTAGAQAEGILGLVENNNSDLVAAADAVAGFAQLVENTNRRKAS